MPLKTLSRTRRLAAAAALLVIAAAWIAVLAANRGLTVRDVSQDGLPMRFMAPAGGGDLPGVVVAHGFSGSQQLMLGYGYVLARAGYGVLLLDFSGHAANSRPLDPDRDQLQEDLALATTVLAAQPEVDAARLALLGHSMGSGAVMRAGVAARDRYRAVVAISPTPADVSPAAPRNLLLQAGALEPAFAANALALLAEAGGGSDDFAGGLARRYLEIPRVEHITILFNARSHAAALEWIGRALDGPAGGAYLDRRMLWYLLQLGAGLLLFAAVAPALALPGATPPRAVARWRGFLAPVAAAPAAGGVLWLLNQVLEVARFAGLRVGGALGLWLFFFGIAWLLLRGGLPPRPDTRSLLWGILLFVFVWALFGLLAQRVWLPWLLIPRRLLLWVLCAAFCLPWQLASATTVFARSRTYRTALWLGHSAVLLAGLYLLLLLVPGLGFMVLIMPVIPLVLALLAVPGARVDNVWSVGLANALFFGWLIALLFPLTL